MVKNNNGYLKDIADKVGGDSDGVHTDNYYLKQISENISGGGGGDITVDSSLSTTSENPVQNKVITNALNGKADDSDIPQPNAMNSKIMMNGTQSAGMDMAYAKADHVHPSDTSKVDSADLGTLELVITYQDSSTETVNVTKWE